MKRYFILIMAVWLMVLPTTLFPQEEHKKIVEEVRVNWWQVPVFAVDEKGNPVNDLAPGDIKIRMNDQTIPQFVLIKRDFRVQEQKEETAPGSPAPVPPPVLKKKVVFLLFDLILSDRTCITYARQIAKEIIRDTKEDTHFIIMSIDSYSGLVYLGEGTGNTKPQLIDLVDKEVKLKKRKNPRGIDLKEFFNLDIGLEPGDSKVMYESASKYFKRSNMMFFNSSETLYFYLNSIEDHKFIYLFSEGISEAIMNKGGSSLTGEMGADLYYLERMAKYLNRCGGTLFIINPMKELVGRISPVSGDTSLSYLARKSGGFYLGGTREQIREKIQNLHRAYYEISFPDNPQMQGTLREIHISSIKKGIQIYSLHSLEKRKPYTLMEDVEKEILVLHLITQPENSLMKRKISAYNARVDKTQKNHKNITYTVTLPPGYLNKTIEMYKVFLAIGSGGAAQVEKIEKESLHPKQNQLDIQFQLGKDAKAAQDKKEKATGKEKETETTETKTYFVLVEGNTDPARALVHGIELYDEDPELEAWEKSQTAKKTKGGKSIDPQEMQRILQGAADYCERLKQSAFHFYCREKILETHNPLSEVDPQALSIDAKSMKTQPDRALDQIRNQAHAQVRDCEFGYRLFKQGNNIKEERNYISSSDEIEVRGDQVITANAFFAERTVFGPVTVLDRGRQESYDIRFVEFDEYKRRPTVVVEALPKNPAETPGTYGKIWIDRDDFSVLKIEANPQSIRGYDKLKAFAEKLNTKLYLTLESEFDEIYGDLRFPTKVRMAEKYKGGPIIRQHRGSIGWERTITEFTYTDYQFFDVQTEVKVQK